MVGRVAHAELLQSATIRANLGCWGKDFKRGVF